MNALCPPGAFATAAHHALHAHTAEQRAAAVATMDDLRDRITRSSEDQLSVHMHGDR